MNRRTAIGIATTVAAGVVLTAGSPASAEPVAATPDSSGGGHPTTPRQVRRHVEDVYQQQVRRAGGTWNSYISVANADGSLGAAVEQNPDVVVEAYSVNKIAVAVAVMDKVDRGLLTLTQQIEVTEAIVVVGGDGIFVLDGAYPSSVTLGHVLAAFLTVSDDTAVRLAGLVVPALEINSILVAKGFPNTQVQPVANPNRYFLGLTTARETHGILQGLVNGTLLSPSSSAFLLGLLRSPIAFTDGIRRTMSSEERSRVATKAGWFADGRNEAGIMFNQAGAPLLTYSMFASGLADPDNFGSTHPALQARSVMGPAFLKAIGSLSAPAAARLMSSQPAYRPSNGG